MLNWFLIAMIVMLPLRGVLALDRASCEMHDEASQIEQGHAMHMAGHVTMHMQEDVDLKAAGSDDCCCCDKSMQCSSHCGPGAGASVIIQSAFTVPELKRVTLRTHVNSGLIFRDPEPPVRPPENLQI